MPRARRSPTAGRGDVCAMAIAARRWSSSDGVVSSSVHRGDRLSRAPRLRAATRPARGPTTNCGDPTRGIDVRRPRRDRTGATGSAPCRSSDAPRADRRIEFHRPRRFGRRLTGPADVGQIRPSSACARSRSRDSVPAPGGIPCPPRPVPLVEVRAPRRACRARRPGHRRARPRVPPPLSRGRARRGGDGAVWLQAEQRVGVGERGVRRREVRPRARSRRRSRRSAVCRPSGVRVRQARMPSR